MRWEGLESGVFESAHGARDRTDPTSDPSLAAVRPERVALLGLAFLLQERGVRMLMSVKILVKSRCGTQLGLNKQELPGRGPQLIGFPHRFGDLGEYHTHIPAQGGPQSQAKSQQDLAAGQVLKGTD